MTPVGPITAASRDLALALARDIAGRHPDHYGAVPPAYLALRVREIMRFCEHGGIWEPADIAMVVRAMFLPAPDCLAEEDRSYAVTLLSNSQATPEARARSLSMALTGAAPPPRDPAGLV